MDPVFLGDSQGFRDKEKRGCTLLSWEGFSL